MLDPINLSINTFDTYEHFNEELQKIATALDNEDNIALVRREDDGTECIEIKTATLWDRIVKWLGWKCLGGDNYQKSEVRRVMQVFLDNNQDFVEDAFKDRSSLSNDRIFKYIPRDYFFNFRNGQITMIETERANEIIRSNARIVNIEMQEVQANERKRQIEDEINMLEPTRNELMGEHKKNYDKIIQSIPKTQPIHKPNPDETLSVKLEALRKDVRIANIIFISSDGQEIHAHSAFLNCSEYVLNFMGDSKTFPDSNEESISNITQPEKCKLYFTDPRFDADTINNFLDLKYGIPAKEKLTQAQMVNLLYFANYVLDEPLKNKLAATLLNDVCAENSEAFLPGLFDVIIDFTRDLTNQIIVVNKFKELIESADASVKLKWFELLYKHKNSNDTNINFWLGSCYSHGAGVAEDKDKGFMYFKFSAEQGLAVAQFNVGACYNIGEGVEKDTGLASYWFQLAADQGLILLSLCS